MNKQAHVMNFSSTKKLVKVTLYVAGLVVCIFLFLFLKGVYNDHQYNNEIEKEREKIKLAQSIANAELEVKAQNGDPYAQYALGSRILDSIERWKAGASDALELEGEPLDADIWHGKNGQVALDRLQVLTSEGNDYARYSWEEWSISNEARRNGVDRLKYPRVKPIADFRLLDYSGQLLLAAAETAVANKMHSFFLDELDEKLFQWSLIRLFFHSPINQDKEFLRRWRAVQSKIPHSMISDDL